jgi:hypothetical protein
MAKLLEKVESFSEKAKEILEKLAAEYLLILPPLLLSYDPDFLKPN